MANERFFDESREQSVVKATIVDKYFWFWFCVMNKHAEKVAYIDLFAGPGRYQDGTLSTPLKILTRAIETPDLRSKLVTLFNDKDPESVSTLRREIAELPGIETLKYKPDVRNEEVGAKIVESFEKRNLIPTLFFVDPWGYKGLSVRLVNSVVKNWGCDALFFFNYNRISMGIPNPLVREHMEALFGSSRAKELEQQVDGLEPEVREATIVEALARALNDHGHRYVLPFRFRDARGTRTSHHLILVTKHILPYSVAKEIMAKESSQTEQGVPSFEFNPRVLNQGLLFDLATPLDDLQDMLVKKFAGRTMSMVDVYNNHHIGRRFIKANYKDALNDLEEAGKITVVPPAHKRQVRDGKRTMADTVKVTFPRPEAETARPR